MTQLDLSAAGIRANIEHYRAVRQQQQNQLQLTENELAFWMAVARKQLLQPEDIHTVK